MHASLAWWLTPSASSSLSCAAGSSFSTSQALPAWSVPAPFTIASLSLASSSYLASLGAPCSTMSFAKPCHCAQG